MSMSRLPPLPPLNDADYVLAVFSHHSLPTQDSDEYGDPRRLAALGARITQQTIAYHCFMRRPPYSAEDIEARCQDGLPDAVHLLTTYNLRTKIRAAPAAVATLDTPEEARLFFNKYVGAVYLKSGLAAIQEWISQLLDADMPPPPLPIDVSQTRAAHGSFPPAPAPQPSFSPTPPQPSSPPPPPPSYSYTPNSVPPTNNTGFQILAAFNQMAQQRGLSVSYPARSEGQHHMPTWSVRCCINGEVKGEGVGKNQKQAKEMAARQAWASIGWGNAPE